MRTLAIDIGGTGLKMRVLDAAGTPVTKRTRTLTPSPATPAAVLDLLQADSAAHAPYDRIAAGFPGVVVDGVTLSAPNLDPSWAGFPLADALQERLGAPVRVANDADVQGFGAIEGRGVELVVTLGTGVGGALFVDGRLVPNLELGHAPFEHGKSFEQVLGKAALEASDPDTWHAALDRALAVWLALFNPRRLYLGGGNAKKVREVPDRVVVVDNAAGLLGGIALWS